jgi:hypothetical protein
MKDRYSALPLLLFASLVLTGCELLGDIFKAGVWIGVILVLVVIAVIGWVVSKGRS